MCCKWKDMIGRTTKFHQCKGTLTPSLKDNMSFDAPTWH